MANLLERQVGRLFIRLASLDTNRQGILLRTDMRLYIQCLMSQKLVEGDFRRLNLKLHPTFGISGLAVNHKVHANGFCARGAC
jgi:hypothetical protein